MWHFKSILFIHFKYGFFSMHDLSICEKQHRKYVLPLKTQLKLIILTRSDVKSYSLQSPDTCLTVALMQKPCVLGYLAVFLHVDVWTKQLTITLIWPPTPTPRAMMSRCWVSWLSSIRTVRPTHTGSPSATSLLANLHSAEFFEEQPTGPAHTSQRRVKQSSWMRHIETRAHTRRHKHFRFA